MFPCTPEQNAQGILSWKLKLFLPFSIKWLTKSYFLVIPLPELFNSYK